MQAKQNENLVDGICTLNDNSVTVLHRLSGFSCLAGFGVCNRNGKVWGHSSKKPSSSQRKLSVTGKGKYRRLECRYISLIGRTVCSPWSHHRCPEPSCDKDIPARWKTCHFELMLFSVSLSHCKYKLIMPSKGSWGVQLQTCRGEILLGRCCLKTWKCVMSVLKNPHSFLQCQPGKELPQSWKKMQHLPISHR